MLVGIHSFVMAQNNLPRNPDRVLTDVYTQKQYPVFYSSGEKHITFNDFPIKLEFNIGQFWDTSQFQQTNKLLITWLDTAIAKGQILDLVQNKFEQKVPWYILNSYSFIPDSSDINQTIKNGSISEVEVLFVSVVNGSFFLDLEVSMAVSGNYQDDKIIIYIPLLLDIEKQAISIWKPEITPNQLAKIKEKGMAFLQAFIQDIEHDFRVNPDDAFEDVEIPGDSSVMEQFCLDKHPNPNRWLNWNELDFFPFAWGILFRFPNYSPSEMTLFDESVSGFIPFDSLDSKVFNTSPFRDFFPTQKMESKENYLLDQSELYRTISYYPIDLQKISKENGIKQLTIRIEQKRNDSTWFMQKERKMFFNANGQIHREEYHNRSRNWQYDNNHQLIAIIDSSENDGYSKPIWYDKHNNIIQRYTNYTYQITKYDGDKAYQFSLETDSEQSEITAITFDHKRTTIGKKVYHYNDRNQIMAIGGEGNDQQVQIIRNAQGQVLEEYNRNLFIQRIYNDTDQLTQVMKIGYEKRTKIEVKYPDLNTQLPNLILDPASGRKFHLEWEKW